MDDAVDPRREALLSGASEFRGERGDELDADGGVSSQRGTALSDPADDSLPLGRPSLRTSVAAEFGGKSHRSLREQL